MKKNIILVAMALTLLGCDSGEDKVKKFIKCGLAVKELGDEAARENFDKNKSNILDGKTPDLTSYDISRIGNEARDELGTYFPNKRERARRMIDEYEKDYCVDTHKVPETDKIEFLKRVIDY